MHACECIYYLRKHIWDTSVSVIAFFGGPEIAEEVLLSLYHFFFNLLEFYTKTDTNYYSKII